MTKEVRLRSNQRDGFVAEAYADASSKVENLKRLSRKLGDRPEMQSRIDDLYRRAKNYREQARTRLTAFEEADDELQVPQLLTKDRIDELVEERSRLVGEIFIRLYKVDLAVNAAKKGLGL